MLSEWWGRTAVKTYARMNEQTRGMSERSKTEKRNLSQKEGTSNWQPPNALSCFAETAYTIGIKNNLVQGIGCQEGSKLADN
jgi:hypothetical protein